MKPINPESSINPERTSTSSDRVLHAANLSLPSGIGIGKTDELTLRVSAACLTLTLLRVGTEEMVLFERVIKIDEKGDYKTQLQPIGGAAGILNCHAFEAKCGPYNFDTVAAAQESDLRIFIRPDQWANMREFLNNEFVGKNTGIIENTPLREIQEEIGELLEVQIDSSFLHATRVGCHFQDRPRESARQDDAATVRVFAIDEVLVVDPLLTSCIVEYCVTHDLNSQLDEIRNSGLKKSSGLCIVPLKDVLGAVAALAQHERERLIPLGSHTLANNVYATVMHRLSDVNPNRSAL